MEGAGTPQNTTPSIQARQQKLCEIQVSGYKIILKFLYIQDHKPIM